MVLSNVHKPLPVLSYLDMKINHEKANFQQNIYRKPTGYFVYIYIAVFECFILKLTVQELSAGELVGS